MTNTFFSSSVVRALVGVVCGSLAATILMLAAVGPAIASAPQPTCTVAY